MIATQLCFNRENKVLVLYALLFLVGFSIPFSYAINSICVGAFCLFSLFFLEKHTFKDFLKKGINIHFLFMLYFALQFVGVLYSEDMSRGFNYWVQNIVFLILPIAFKSISDVLSKKAIKASLYGLFVGVLVILLSIHVNIFNKIFTENLGLKSLLTKFVRVAFVSEGIVEIHPPYFGLMVVFCLIGVLLIKHSKVNLLNLGLKSLLTLYFLVSLYGISSFMSIVLIGLFLCCCLVYMLKKGDFKLLAIILISLTTVIVLVFKTNYRKITKLFPGESLIGRIEWSFFKEKGDTSRPENWKSVLSVVKDNAIFGIGSDGGLKYLQKYRSKNSESFRNKHNAHNQFLETLLRHGIIGLLVYLAILVLIFFSAFKSKNFIFIAFILVFVISSLTESYLVRQIGLIFFTFYSLLFCTFYNFEYSKNRLKL